MKGFDMSKTYKGKFNKVIYPTFTSSGCLCEKWIYKANPNMVIEKLPYNFRGHNAQEYDVIFYRNQTLESASKPTIDNSPEYNYRCIVGLNNAMWFVAKGAPPLRGPDCSTLDDPKVYQRFIEHERMHLEGEDLDEYHERIGFNDETKTWYDKPEGVSAFAGRPDCSFRNVNWQELTKNYEKETN
jgi:hypothetical protein